MRADTSGDVHRIIDLDHFSADVIEVPTIEHTRWLQLKLIAAYSGYHHVLMEMWFDNLARVREFGAIVERVIAITAWFGMHVYDRIQ